MGQDSKIEWTDATWNPIAGCSMCSPGCARCYAERMSKRLAAMALADIAKGKNPGRKGAYLHVLNDKGRWNGHVEQVPQALSDPLKWKRPRRVFVNSMSDLFHDDVPFEYVDRVFAVMALCPQHTFQILTKRPERMAEYLNDSRDMLGMKVDERVNAEASDIPEPMPFLRKQHWPLPNVWLGTSIEDQQRADERIPHLLRCPAAVRFLSCEPLLGPVDLRRIGKLSRGNDIDSLTGWRGTYQYKARDESECSVGVNWSSGGNRVDWVIVGGESGHGARPMHPDWARSIRDQCQAAGVPLHFKQWGEWMPFKGNKEIPVASYNAPVCLLKADGRTIRPYCAQDAPGHQMCRLGKHAAGRLLDGRTWDEFPKGTK